MKDMEEMAMFRYVARLAGGTFLRVEGEDVIVYLCWGCGKEHRCRAALSITELFEAPKIPKRAIHEDAEARQTAIPTAFYRAFE
jgi:hypothetical protein